MAMCAMTNKHVMLSKQRAKAENERRLILGLFTAGKIWSIDEIAFQTKLPRAVVKKRANDSAWFSPPNIAGGRRGRYQLTAAGIGARRRGLHLQRVYVSPPRVLTPRRAAIVAVAAKTPSTHFQCTPDVKADYVPNEEQIAAAIAEIQATWDDEERWKRRTSLAEPLGSLE